jgi:hypothetical protein
MDAGEANVGTVGDRIGDRGMVSDLDNGCVGGDSFGKEHVGMVGAEARRLIVVAAVGIGDDGGGGGGVIKGALRRRIEVNGLVVDDDLLFFPTGVGTVAAG